MQGSENSLSKKLQKELEESNKNLSFSHKRILKDLEEFEFNVDPTMGLSARPITGNLFEWHANLKGPEGTPYEGGIYHIKIELPKDYPNSPPKFTSLCQITNPFFQNNRYQSEMLNADDWCSGYSIFSVLLQIQCGLWEFFGNQGKMKEEATQSKSYNCPDCGHKGENDPWPKFECLLEDGPVDYSKLTSEERVIQDTYCFNTKLYISDTPLGTGVAFARAARTSTVDRIFTTVDLISLKAYKSGLRKATSKKKFSHWLPIWFGSTYGEKDKFLDMMRSTLSSICTNQQNNFDESMILQVMPKLMLSHIVQLLQDKAYSSIKGLRMFLYFLRAFILLVKEYPSVQNQIEQLLDKFIADEKFRNKSECPNLGVLMMYLCATPKYKFEDIKNVYIFEKLERNVYHMLKAVPQLEEQSAQMDDNRSKLTFQATPMSYHITLFFSFFHKYIVEKGDKKDLKLLANKFDSGVGRLDPTLEDALQAEIKQILNVNNFADWFSRLGMPNPNKEKLLDILKSAIDNSKLKKYHGGFDHTLEIPSNLDAIKNVLKTKYSVFDLADEEKKQFQYEASDPMWQQALFFKYPWTQYYIKRAEQEESKINAGEIAMMYHPSHFSEVTYDDSIQQYFQFLSTHNEFVQPTFNQYEGMDWKDLYIMLDLQDLLKIVPYDTSEDQALLKSYLALAGPSIKTLNLHLSHQNSHKVLHYVKEFCPNLTSLHLIANSQIRIDEALKSIAELRGLKKIEIRGVRQCIDIVPPPQLSSNITINGSLLLNALSAHQDSLEELILEKFNMNHITMQQIEQSNLVRLRSLWITHSLINKQAGLNIAKTMLLTPNLTHLNLNFNQIEGSIKEIVDSVVKTCQGLTHFSVAYNNLIHCNGLSDTLTQLLKGCSCLQFLNLACTGAAGQLSDNFYNALSKHPALTHLYIGNQPDVNGQIVEKIGESVSQNYHNGGNLQYLKIAGLFNKFSTFHAFLQKLFLPWQGESQANRDYMIKDLDLRGNDFKDVCQGQFYQEYMIDESIRQLVQKVRGLSFEGCNVNDKLAYALSYAIRQSKDKANITALNLHNNKITKSGAQKLCKALLTAKQLQKLSISQNKIGTGGAHSLAELISNSDSLQQLFISKCKMGTEGAYKLQLALKNNFSLQYLDVSQNNIKDKGFVAIIDAIYQNKGSILKDLNLRKNKIFDKGFQVLNDQIIQHGQTNLMRIHMAQNEIGLQLAKKHTELIKERGVILFSGIEKRIANNQETILFLSGIKPNVDLAQIKNHLDSQNAGLILTININMGKKQKKHGANSKNRFAFVEFQHKHSIPRVLGMLKTILNK